MTKPDLSNRTPTVQRVPAFPWPRWRMTPPKPAEQRSRDSRANEGANDRPDRSTAPASPRNRSGLPPISRGADGPSAPARDTASRPARGGGWLLRESVTLLGMAGAALSVLAQLAWVMPLSRPFMELLGWWVTLSSDVWIANYERLGFYPQSHLQAAIALAVFLATMGLGARISGTISGTVFARRWGFLQGMTWPSLAIMGVLAVIFLLGYDPNSGAAYDDAPGRGGTLKYVLAMILMAGYAVGDALGQRGFHDRLYGLAVLLLLLVALNIWLLTTL